MKTNSELHEKKFLKIKTNTTDWSSDKPLNKILIELHCIDKITHIAQYELLI